MRHLFFALFVTICIGHAPAARADSAGSFETLKTCIMQNDAPSCRALITPGSVTLFNRFVAHGLMVCLPTNFTLESQTEHPKFNLLTASMPAGDNKRLILKLAFTKNALSKLDIPTSLSIGFGKNWKNKIDLAEQLYLMMKKNMGDKLGCDQLAPLLAP